MVTNLAFALPTRLKVRGFAKKVLLRKAMEPLLPAEVVHGRKRGFSIPAAAWLRGELEPFARETLSPENLQRQGFFHAQPVTRLLDEHVRRGGHVDPDPHAASASIRADSSRGGSCST